jgi:hypothetical protein
MTYKIFITLFLVLSVLSSCSRGKDAGFLLSGFTQAQNKAERLAFIKKVSTPVNHVLVYVNPENSAVNEIIDSLLLNGYSCKIAEPQLLDGLQSKNQTFYTNGSEYHLLLTDTLWDINAVELLAKKGGVIMLPAKPENVGNIELNNFKRVNFGGGGVLIGSKPHRQLMKLGVEPQLITGDINGLAWEQREFNGIDLFLITNTSDFQVNFDASFGTLAGAPELWDPETGKPFVVEPYYQERGSVKFKVSLKPGQLQIYVFGTRFDRDEMKVYTLQ